MASQLSFAQRTLIERLLQEQYSFSAIARELGVHRSTVMREVDRNGSKEDYNAVVAHQKKVVRKRMAGLVGQLFSTGKSAAFIARKSGQHGRGNHKVFCKRYRRQQRNAPFFEFGRKHSDTRLRRPDRPKLFRLGSKADPSRFRDHFKEEALRFFRFRRFRYRCQYSSYHIPCPQLRSVHCYDRPGYHRFFYRRSVLRGPYIKKISLRPPSYLLHKIYRRPIVQVRYYTNGNHSVAYSRSRKEKINHRKVKPSSQLAILLTKSMELFIFNLSSFAGLVPKRLLPLVEKHQLTGQKEWPVHRAA